jgi:predicted AlkP superfamily pyrophosphatase or phosphodiesterase
MSRYLLIFTFFMLVLQSCAPTAAPEAPVPVAIPTATLTPSPTLPAPTDTALPTPTFTPAPPIARVLIVTFDGLRPDAIAASKMENLLALMQAGAYTLSARTIMPSTTLPAHSSMFLGTCPAKHIVRWDEYVPQNGYARGTDVFDLAKAAGLRTAMVVGKEKLRQITEPASTDYFAFVDETDKTDDFTTVEGLALEQIRRGFNLLFVHFPNGDLAGHEFGWMSREQFKAYAGDDRSFGRLVQSLKDHGMYDSTIIIVTSDHGGHDTTHGTDSVEDMTIPWIISGPRVLPAVLQTQVRIMDTAATIAYVLGLPQQPEWDGVPVFEAFGAPITKVSQGCHT